MAPGAALYFAFPRPAAGLGQAEGRTRCKSLGVGIVQKWERWLTLGAC